MRAGFRVQQRVYDLVNKPGAEGEAILAGTHCAGLAVLKPHADVD